MSTHCDVPANQELGVSDLVVVANGASRWLHNIMVPKAITLESGQGMSQGDSSTVRIDKWLWAARFFKARGLAARACELGRVQCNKQPVKPARGVHVGEFLQIHTEGGEFEVEVLLLSEIRGPASIAHTLYRETESSREKREKVIQERRAGMLFSPAPENRPSKRDRRKIRDFRGE